jgi:type II secretory pathway component PulC
METKVAPDKTHPLASKVEPPGRTFIARLNLQPRLLAGRVKGYVVRPDDPSILNGTPLQPGDVLLEVDGVELDSESVAALARNVGQYEDVFVRYERGNAEQDGMLPLGTR